MSIEYIDAEDELFGMVNQAFALAITGITPAPSLFFPSDLNVPPSPNDIYATCSFVIVTDGQSGIGAPGGKSLYEAVGLLTVQIYAPKQVASAFRTAQEMADMIRNVFRGHSTSGEIWFRNPRVTPVGGNTTMNQVNVVVTCTYKTEK
jgi:hypothetical protein